MAVQTFFFLKKGKKYYRKCEILSLKSFITKILSKVLKLFLDLSDWEYLFIHIWMTPQTFQIIIMWAGESKLELFERQEANNIWCKGNKTLILQLLLEPWLPPRPENSWNECTVVQWSVSHCICTEQGLKTDMSYFSCKSCDLEKQTWKENVHTFM